MSKLLRVIEAAAGDARRAEAFMYDVRSDQTLRADPDGALLAFELRATTVGDEAGEREARTERRNRGVRAAQQPAFR